MSRKSTYKHNQNKEKAGGKTFTEFWRDGQKLAFHIGIHIAEYWELTYGEYLDCILGYRERNKAIQQQQDQLNHTLGQYIAIGFNNPSQYPKQPFLKEETSEKRALQPMSDEDMAAAARRSAAQWKELNHGRKQHDN